MQDNSINYRTPEGLKLLSQALRIGTFDGRIIGELKNPIIHEITISAAPNIIFIYDAKEKSRTTYFSYAWAALHDYNNCFSMRLAKGGIAKIKSNPESKDYSKKAIVSPYNDEQPFVSQFQILTAEEYLKNEGSMRPFMAVAVEDSGEIISAYDWRKENTKLRRKYLEKARITEEEFEEYKTTIKELERLFPGSNWK